MNGVVNPEMSGASGRLGRETTPAVLVTPLVRGLTAGKERLMVNRTVQKTLVRKNRTNRTWQVTCPCGYTWRTRWHRLAVLFATGHKHQAVA